MFNLGRVLEWDELTAGNGTIDKKKVFLLVLKEGTGWLVLGSRTGSVVIKMRGCTVSFYRGSFLYFLEFPIFGRGGEIFYTGVEEEN